jgi:hypothetical protein
MECGSTAEAGLTDREADQALAETAANLHFLADCVDAAGTVLTPFPRKAFALDGFPVRGAVPELDNLEEGLAKLRRGLPA